MRGFAIVGALSAALCALPAQAGEQLAFFHVQNVTDSGLRGTGKIALTFDDGPSAATDDILATLRAHGVKATFFVLGSRVSSRPGTMAEMQADGHVVANHSATHPRLGRKYQRDPDLLIDQVRTTHEAIVPFLQPTQRLYFRAPYGVWRSAHAETLNADPELSKYIGPIYWDVGGRNRTDEDGELVAAADWECWKDDISAEDCGDGYLREIRRLNGGVVLLHDLRQRTADMVAAMVPSLIAEGFTFITLDEVDEYDIFEGPVPEPKPDDETPMAMIAANTSTPAPAFVRLDTAIGAALASAAHRLGHSAAALPLSIPSEAALGD